MKKLLSLLSVLTVSGTAVPTTIAASPYQKEENNLDNNKTNNSLNNSSQLNNSKKRIKREIIDIKPLLPYQINIKLPHGFLLRNNPPDISEIKNAVWAASQLPSNFPYKWAFEILALSRYGTIIKVNNINCNGNIYNGYKYVAFNDF